ncbi:MULTISPECIES: terminase small subunit [Arsenophonus]|jgi:hypothetical protein|nr:MULTISPECIES: terminase small subunit [Arsenophonus]UBX30335.1 terminase small subunit [Arsenophonus apicola]
MALTEEQEAFCRIWLINFNGIKAASRLGYKKIKK